MNLIYALAREASIWTGKQSRRFKGRIRLWIVCLHAAAGEFKT
jgi:hypothetical protein